LSFGPINFMIDWAAALSVVVATAAPAALRVVRPRSQGARGHGTLHDHGLVAVVVGQPPGKST
jgi:uncharacterized protein (DUF2252 family)